MQILQLIRTICTRKRCDGRVTMKRYGAMDIRMNDQAHFSPAEGQYAVTRWQGSRVTQLCDRIAEEVPVALVYNGLAHVVIMASPCDLEDLALGFSLSEAIVGNAGEVNAIE